MSEQSNLIPVLQLSDLDALKAAQVHLGKEGYQSKVEPFNDLSQADCEDWMTAENGGYLFYLKRSEYTPAMDLLGKFFGCTD